LITVPHTANALAAFLRTLVYLNSAFDRYLQGDTLALTKQQQDGFNLFMGKAQCGTCHFAPLFNGLTPPLFQLTEFEVLGTSLSDTLEHPRSDPDQGRFGVFPISFYKQAFKTPTVRNAAVTAPYMHNGSFSSLEKVVDFYDKGGGIGLGLPVENQTLSAAPLHLTAEEKKAVISFMEALTDQL
jgi:cytochrome c peroxidase